MFRIVVNRVNGRHRSPRRRLIFTSVHVAVEARKIAARDFETQTVAGAKYIARRPQVDDEPVDLAGVHENWARLRIAIARPNDSFGQIFREAVGPDVHEFAGEIGVGGQRRRVEFQADRPSDLGVL